MVTRIPRERPLRWGIIILPVQQKQVLLLLLLCIASSCVRESRAWSVPSSPAQSSRSLHSQLSDSKNGLSFGDVLQATQDSSILVPDNTTRAQNGSLNTNTTHPPYNNGQQSSSWQWQYWCDSCACGFNKLKSYRQHNKGKRHQAILEQADQLWEAYQQSGPTYYDTSVGKDIVTRDWSLDWFLEGLQARSRSSIKHVLTASPSLSALSGTGGSGGNQLDPSLRLGDLSPDKRAALWRYLYTSPVPHLATMVAALPPHYVRLKEVLESVEVFVHVQRLLSRSTQRGQKPQRISDIYDVGCGHGLVGMLCAATHPKIRVHSIDREPRDSFQAQRDAFVSAGMTMDNLHFMPGDLSILQDYKPQSRDDHQQQSSTSLLLCVHGCKSLTHESIEWAQLPQNQWAWLVVPCCLQLEHHLDATRTALKVASDDLRFAMLCGALTSKYQPDTVTTMDSRITARGVVMMASSRRMPID